MMTPTQRINVGKRERPSVRRSLDLSMLPIGEKVKAFETARATLTQAGASIEDWRASIRLRHGPRRSG
jgi:hypothetical protein